MLKLHRYASSGRALFSDEDEGVPVPETLPDDAALSQAFLLQGQLPAPLQPVTGSAASASVDLRQRLADNQQAMLAQRMAPWQPSAQPHDEVLAEMEALATLDPAPPTGVETARASPALLQFCRHACNRLQQIQRQLSGAEPAAYGKHLLLAESLARAAAVLHGLQTGFDDASGREALGQLQEAVESLRDALRRRQAEADREQLLQRLALCDPATLPHNLLGQLLSSGSHAFSGTLTFTTLAIRQLPGGLSASTRAHEMQTVSRAVTAMPGQRLTPVYAAHPT